MKFHVGHIFVTRRMGKYEVPGQEEVMCAFPYRMYDSLSFLFFFFFFLSKGCMILSIYLPHIIEAILVTPNSNLKITMGIYAKKWFYVMISLVLIS